MSDASRLDARYGRRASDPRRTRVLVALGLALLLGLTGVLYAWSQADGSLTYVTSGYHADSATQMTVSFSVTKGASQRVSCRVVAKDRYTDVVGSVDVDFSDPGSQVGRTVSFPTRSLAVVGEVDSCRVVG
jgi:hypothetical protein